MERQAALYQTHPLPVHKMVLMPFMCVQKNINSVNYVLFCVFIYLWELPPIIVANDCVSHSQSMEVAHHTL